MAHQAAGAPQGRVLPRHGFLGGAVQARFPGLGGLFDDEVREPYLSEESLENDIRHHEAVLALVSFRSVRAKGFRNFVINAIIEHDGDLGHANVDALLVRALPRDRHHAAAAAAAVKQKTNAT